MIERGGQWLDDNFEESRREELEAEQREREREQWEQELKVLDRLASAGSREEEKIRSGSDTSAAQLDRHLQANMTFYQWEAKHSSPRDLEDMGQEREEMGIRYLKLQKILGGSYHKEKADYCHENSLFHRGKAEKIELELAAGSVDPRMEEHERQSMIRQRQYAANWLRTEANCLEMPEAKSAAPRPPQPDH